MKKVLYFMGVEWNWIFQRPHIFALGLEKEYDVTVVCPKQMFHRANKKNQRPERLIELLQIPFQEKVTLLRKMTTIWHKCQLRDIYAYDIIWIGYPIFSRFIPKDYTGTVVYDCMDNFEALYPDQRKRAVRYVCKQENELLNRADILLASSEKLREKMLRVVPDKEIYLIRNGYSDLTITEPTVPEKKECYTVGYIGTISAWFDSRLLEKSLCNCNQVQYDLAGPIADHTPINDERVHYSGVIAHTELTDYVKKVDCLIMPFQITEIVLYVDPVKIYEYIAFGKCIIAAWYPEIDRFSDFVYFYHDEKEYFELLTEMVRKKFPPKYHAEKQREFLEANSWECRQKELRKILMKD